MFPRGVFVLAVHLVETACAVAVCRRHRLAAATTIAWVLQTLAVGMFSLRHLLWPVPPRARTE